MTDRRPTGSSRASAGRTAASSLFRPDRLSIGLALPVRADPAERPDGAEQIRIARHAEAVGLDAVWVRDVPLNGDWYPEAFGHPDPFVTLGAAAAVTERIVLGTAATVLTLRHPLHVAKAAVSLQHLSGDRFVLGLGSGDRPEEFAAFEASTDDRRALFRDHWTRLAQALDHPQSVAVASAPNTAYALRPPPLSPLTRLAVGSSGQTLEWIARNAAGWATYHRPAEVQRDRHALWRRAVETHAPGAFRSFSVAMGVALDPDPNAPLEPLPLGVRGGARRLADELEAMRLSGVHHVILNLAPGPVSPRQGLDMIGRAFADDANRASVA